MSMSQTTATNIKGVCESDKVRLKLSGLDGNSFSIMARAVYAMRKAKYAEVLIDKYKTEAMSGNYDNLLQTTMIYCDVH